MVLVVRRVPYALEVLRVGLFPSLGEHAEVREYVILRVSSCPFTTYVVSPRPKYRSVVRKTPQGAYSPNVMVHGPHHLMLGMVNSRLQGLRLAITLQVGGAAANGTVGVHPDERRVQGLPGL